MRIQSVLRRAERLFALPPATHLQIVFVTDRVMQTYNRRAFRRNRPTDVLAFPLHDLRPSLRPVTSALPTDPDGLLRLGDVFVSLDTAARAARRARRTFSEEAIELVAHGVLHLLGHNHARPRDMASMARMTARLLA